jgi:hypothetical protein
LGHENIIRLLWPNGDRWPANTPFTLKRVNTSVHHIPRTNPTSDDAEIETQGTLYQVWVWALKI